MDVKQLVRFMCWADNRLLSAAAEDPELLCVLDHIRRGEVVWMRRIKGDEAAQISAVETAGSLTDLRALWPQIHSAWNQWVEQQNETDTWNELVPHQDSRGNRFALPAWQIATHLVNHGSYHRGQAVHLMKKAGISPPATDLILFFRDQA